MQEASDCEKRRRSKEGGRKGSLRSCAALTAGHVITSIGLGLSPARHAPGRPSSHPQYVEQKLGNIQQWQLPPPLLFSCFPDWKEK